MPLGARLPIPRTVWALGLISLFMDLSSETIHALFEPSRDCRTLFDASYAATGTSSSVA